MASRAEAKRLARAQRQTRAAEAALRERRARRLKLLAAALGSAAVIALAAVLFSSSGAEQTGSDRASGPLQGAADVERRFAGIHQDGLALGDPKAPVTLVEFADLQCPFCRDAAVSGLPPVVDGYVRTGKVRIEFRNFAILGPESEKAARALDAAAEQGKAWQFVELWYHNQGEENTGYVTDDFIRRIAGGVRGLDAEKVVAAANDPGRTKSISLAAREAQIRGIQSTPSFLIAAGDAPVRPLQLGDPSDPAQLTRAIEQAGGRQ